MYKCSSTDNLLPERRNRQFREENENITGMGFGSFFLEKQEKQD